MFLVTLLKSINFIYNNNNNNNNNNRWVQLNATGLKNNITIFYLCTDYFIYARIIYQFSPKHSSAYCLWNCSTAFSPDGCCCCYCWFIFICWFCIYWFCLLLLILYMLLLLFIALISIVVVVFVDVITINLSITIIIINID